MTQPRRRRNVAKLLARLNPKGMNLVPSAGNSRGGVPEETALDIAAALGYVAAQGPGPRLAAVVLCLRWWPGMVEGPLQVVGHREIQRTMRTRRVAGEYREAPAPQRPQVRTPAGRLLTAKERAELAKQPPDSRTTVVLVTPALDEDGRPLWEQRKATHVEKVPVEAPGETPAFRMVAAMLAHRQRLRVLRAAADKQRFEKVSDTPEDLIGRVTAPAFCEAWARAVIHEYRHPNHCQTCTPWGRAGEIPRPVEEGGKIRRVEWQTCPTCFGAGVLAWSAKRRAKALRIGEHPWRNYLNPIHEGALSLLRELEWRGARALVRRLGG